METTNRLTGTKQLQSSIKKINGYTIEYGSFNILSPKSAYLNLGSWVRPIEGDLNDHMKVFQRRLRRWVDNAHPQLFGGQLDPSMPIIRIVDYSDSTNGGSNTIRVNNNFTFCSIELTLFFKKPISIRDQDIRDNFELLFMSLIDFLEESTEMIFSPTKLRSTPVVS